MSITRNGHIRCDWCGHFCVLADQETPYGCSSYDPPEPHDPVEYCASCAEALYDKWLERFRSGSRMGYWQKSHAETRAAREAGLLWVSYKYDRRNGEAIQNRYITTDEVDFFVEWEEWHKIKASQTV